MPTYVYRHVKPIKERFGCPEIGTFDIKQSIKDEPLKYCPHCGTEIERVIQPAMFNAPIWNKQTDLLDEGF